MKIKSSAERKKVVLETSPRDSGLPPVAVPELQLKRILVPVDFSPCSRKALDYATFFARQFGAEVVLLHVLESAPPQVAIVEGALLDTTLREEATKRIEQWSADVHPGVSARVLMRDGSAAHREIVATAEECNVDLIIIGNQGRTGLVRALMGSTAESVVRHAPCPVLVIRGREHDFLVEAETDLV